jgi:hypothetical protein
MTLGDSYQITGRIKSSLIKLIARIVVYGKSIADSSAVSATLSILPLHLRGTGKWVTVPWMAVFSPIAMLSSAASRERTAIDDRDAPHRVRCPVVARR